VEKAGANVEAKTNHGWTPLHFASRYRNLTVVQYLGKKAGANVEAKTNNGWTPLHCASWEGRLMVVQYLVGPARAFVEAKDNHGSKPLHFASSRGHLTGVQYLVEQAGANVEAKDNNGWTPLHWASDGGHLTVVQYLVEQAGANVDAKDNRGKTPLDLAREKKHSDIVQFLEERVRRLRQASNAQQEQYQQQQELLRQQQEDLERQRREFENQRQQELLRRQQELERQRQQKLETQRQQELERELIQQQRLKEMSLSSVCPVFLSHTGVDPDAAAFAAFVGAKLQDKYEIDSFLDSKTLDAGDIWRHKIETHAKRCKVFVAILSKHYFERFWCLHELDLAFRNNCIVIPVYFVDPNPSGDKKEIHKVEIPKATNTEFADKLGRMLAEKQLEEDSSVVLRRWWTNMTALDAIHGMRHYSVHKHWMNDFCNQVAEEVHNQLLEEH